MISKFIRFSCRFTVAAAVLLLAIPVPAAQTHNDPTHVRAASEYFIPLPLVPPQLSTDGKTLYNAGPVIVYLYNPNPPKPLRRVPAPADLLGLPNVAAASFLITYVPAGDTDLWGEPCYTFPEDAKTVFGVAASIWSHIVQSSVPITIRACWADLESSSILGYSGGEPVDRDFPGATRANTWYFGSLANALTGSDLAPDYFDMHITYNSNFSWYYGTDGNTPLDQMDLLSVVLHEIAHGLNFSGSMAYLEGMGGWGNNTGYPNIYDTFIRDGSGNQLINTTVYANPSTALGSALTSNNLWFHGANAMAANGGQRVKIFAPSPWMGGSSYAHLDQDTFHETADALMVPMLGPGESIHDPGSITVGILSDLGWQMADTSETLSTPMTPMGATSGAIDISYSYTTGGSTSNQGHQVQYMIDWGDGTNSGWLTVGTRTASHSWASDGAYAVKAKARCAQDTPVESSWSGILAVTITGSGGTANILPNAGFEDGATNWVEEGVYPIITNEPSYAHSGNWFAFLGGYNDADDVLYQDVAIPSNVSQAYVQFWYWIGTEETTNAIAYDTMSVQVMKHDGTASTTLHVLSNLDNTVGYVQSPQYDVTSYKGQTVRLIFHARTDASYSTLFLIDDVSLTVGVSGGGSTDKIGVFHNGIWYLDTNQNWGWDGVPTDTKGVFGVGLVGATPVVGDWNGNGTTKIGVFINGTWYLDMNRNWQWDGQPMDAMYTFGAGLPGAIPVVGDWNGNGIAKIGVYSNGIWYLDINGNGLWDGEPTDKVAYFGAGLTGAVPVTGDWGGTGATKIGVYQNGYWYLDLNGNYQWDGESTDKLGVFGVGLTGVAPVSGDWNGDGISEIGIYQQGLWYLDKNRSWQWEGEPDDQFGVFGVGLTGAVPVPGEW